MCRNLLALLTSLLLSSALLYVPLLRGQNAQQAPEKAGIAPRASAAKYAVHAQNDGMGLGAELLTKKEAIRALAADVNLCCLVA